MGNRLYYAAPAESKESILERGILTPREVLDLIKKGELSKDVLGVSFGNDPYKNVSLFPLYVSLLENQKIIKRVVQEICKERNTEPIIYVIKPEIRSEKKFLSAKRIRELGFNAYSSEALHFGRIGRKFIDGYFKAKTMC